MLDEDGREHELNADVHSRGRNQKFVLRVDEIEIGASLGQRPRPSPIPKLSADVGAPHATIATATTMTTNKNLEWVTGTERGKENGAKDWGFGGPIVALRKRNPCWSRYIAQNSFG